MTMAKTLGYYDTTTITSVKVLLYRQHLCGIQLKLKSIFGSTSFCIKASHLKSFSLLWMGSRHSCIWICGVCYVMEYEF
jgi:hypothetical protein